MASITQVASQYVSYAYRQIATFFRRGRLSNENTYRESYLVELYANNSDLQIPEKTILNLLKSGLSEMKMLDIGVSGGRTTIHFAKLVKEYVGIDYSPEMIIACKNRFYQYPKNISFAVCDARSMEMFQDKIFDLILFSFNGIDYVSHEDRLKVFKEVQRVGKSGGYFCFSTHNLKHAPYKFGFKIQFILHPMRLLRWFSLNFIYNKHNTIRKLKYSKYAVLNDGARNFGLKTHYIAPLAQIQQLNEYFRDIRIFSLASGNELRDNVEADSIADSWLYYLCVIK
jgi:ubiquinone/menaquinone biosynthesis C-methylase UbiE